MKNLLLLILSMLLIISCKPKQQIIKEETIKTLEYRDTVFRIAPDMATLALWLKCDSAKHVQVVKDSIINGTKTRIIYKLIDNKLNVSANVDSAQIAFHYLVAHNMTNNTIVQKQALNWWKIGCISISILFFLFIIAVILLILRH